MILTACFFPVNLEQICIYWKSYRIVLLNILSGPYMSLKFLFAGFGEGCLEDMTVSASSIVSWLSEQFCPNGIMLLNRANSMQLKLLF